MSFVHDLELLAGLQSFLERARGPPVQLVIRRTYQEITALLVSSELDAPRSAGILSRSFDNKQTWGDIRKIADASASVGHLSFVQIGDSRGRAADMLRYLSADADLIVTSGGMAHGDEDHTRLAREQARGDYSRCARSPESRPAWGE